MLHYHHNFNNQNFELLHGKKNIQESETQI